MLSMPKYGGAHHRVQPYHVKPSSSGAIEFIADNCSCRCRAEFCYVCGERWKTCGCAQWDEARLLDRAADIVDRHDGPVRPGNVRGEPARALQRERQVARMADQLRERHECDHHGRWIRRTGTHRCEECHDFLANFILECHQCRLLACVRCKKNRL